MSEPTTACQILNKTKKIKHPIVYLSKRKPYLRNTKQIIPLKPLLVIQLNSQHRRNSLRNKLLFQTSKERYYVIGHEIFKINVSKSIQTKIISKQRSSKHLFNQFLDYIIFNMISIIINNNTFAYFILVILFLYSIFNEFSLKN
ncbi:hypothetical protein BpHYR1_045106 [Brachionus plicatilis]|uniref:Transmembrane protein n=1 Tax=Brachionus plicatilis TaxID=10195 RepID=A0A3M7QY90_BRAPC|nr:hypothetical protein BpHYR1_045106 [Brachionus plicatilis]